MITNPDSAQGVMAQFLAYVEASSAVVVEAGAKGQAMRDCVNDLMLQQAKLFDGVDSSLVILALFSLMWHVTETIRAHSDAKKFSKEEGEKKQNGWLN